MTKRVELLFEFESSIHKKSPAAKKPKATIGIAFGVFFLAIFFLAIFYSESIPGRTFTNTTSAEIVQEGLISKVWLSSEDDNYYVNVIFSAGDERHRKCTLSTTGLYISKNNPEATIGRIITNEDEPSWKYTAMDVGLEKSDYWRLRKAGWPMFGKKSLVIILTDD